MTDHDDYYDLTPDRPEGWVPPVTTTRTFDLAAAWRKFAASFDAQAKMEHGHYDGKGYMEYEQRKLMEDNI